MNRISLLEEGLNLCDGALQTHMLDYNFYLLPSKEIIVLKVHFPMKIVELLDVVVQNSLGVNFDVSSCRSH